MPTAIKRGKNLLVGRPLPSERLEHERLNKKTALAVLSSDAISSVAYATDQILIVLAVLGTAAAVRYRRRWLDGSNCNNRVASLSAVACTDVGGSRADSRNYAGGTDRSS